MKCGFSSFKENSTKHDLQLPKREHNIVLYKTKLNTIYTGTHEIYLERITANSPRNESPTLPRQRTEYFSEVMLQSWSNGTTIKVLDIQENDINVDHLYNFNTLNRMQVKVIDPETQDYAADCLVYAYEYINFLKEHNIKYPFSELFVLYNAPNLENAFWNGYYLTFGNGSTNSYAFVSPSILGHELTHSLIQASINLEYFGDSGALNEAYSDIIGVMFEFYLFDKMRGFGYELGSELYKDGHSMRSFEDPNKCSQPASMKDPLFYRGKEDNGGVHINSGIVNHCFYRMQLVTNRKEVFAIFLKVFFRLKSNSSFNDFKKLLVSYCLDNIDYVNIINKIF